jgi:hypothetical protein
VRVPHAEGEGHKIKVTVTDTAGAMDSVDIVITREKLEAILSAVEAGTKTKDEAVEELLLVAS